LLSSNQLSYRVQLLSWCINTKVTPMHITPYPIIYLLYFVLSTLSHNFYFLQLMVVTVIGARGLRVQRRVAEDLECGIENVTILRLQMRVKHVLINSLVQKWNPRLVISSSVKVRHESSCRCGFSPRVPCQAISNHW
jgi:hypothetical protein